MESMDNLEQTLKLCPFTMGQFVYSCPINLHACLRKPNSFAPVPYCHSLSINKVFF